MRIVEAKWEERNLGVTCAEIEVGKKDSTDSLESLLKERNEQYIVAKVHSGNVEALFALQEKGFRFIETMFETEIGFATRPETPSICKKMSEKVGYHIASKNEIDGVIELVRSGTIFSTDRIALDPTFSKALAGRRYAYWIADTMPKPGSQMYITEYENKNVGFNVFMDKEAYYDGILGGLFPEYLDMGIGFANMHVAVNAAYDSGAKKMISHVSSNNFQMMKLHLLYGMHIRRLNYCLVKHC